MSGTAQWLCTVEGGPWSEANMNEEDCMRFEEIAAALLRGRIVDLSKKITPGGAEGAPGAAVRRYDIEKFIYPPGEIMHYISMESHISTHVEAPSHFIPALYGRPADDVSEVPLKSFFGMGVLLDCKDMAARTVIGPETIDRFGIQRDDIVLVGRSPHRGDDRPWLSVEGVRHLAAKKIKMIGFDDTVFVERPEVRGKSLPGYLVHDLMLTNGIPVIEQVAHLEDLKKSRFFFMGVPPRMGGLDSFPIRAMAIEETE
jgi:arylformamidase